MLLHVSSTCAHHQEVKIVLYSLWCHHTYKCDDTRGCVIQFWPPDDEHMCSKHVEAWNKLIVKQTFCASSWLITKINILRCTASKTSKNGVCYYLYCSCLLVVPLDVRFQTNVLRQPHRFIFCLFRPIFYVVNKYFLMKELITVKYTNRKEKETFLLVVEFRCLDLSRFNILLTNFPLFGSEK